MERARASSYAGEIAGYRTFLATVVVGYITLLVLRPQPWGAPIVPVPVAKLTALSVLYLALGIWGFEYAGRLRRLPVSVGYLLLEFAIGMTINDIAPGGRLPLILLPLAAQAVSLLPRVWAGLMCLLVIAGASGILASLPEWPELVRNVTTATAGVVFVVVYVGVAVREREARHRLEELAGEVAQLAAANERNRLAREIHDTLGHYLTVIHIQLEAAREILRADPERGLTAINRAQTLAKDGLTAVRQSVKALREDARVEGVAEQIRSLVAMVRDESFRATFEAIGAPRPLNAAVALALHRTALEALTNVRKHATASHVGLSLDFGAKDRVRLRVEDDGRGAAALDGGFGLTSLRERAEDLGGTIAYRTEPGHGFTIELELPA